MNHNKPLASPGFTSYRYLQNFTYVMIGANSHEEALKEASRSIDSIPDPKKLEIWNKESCEYEFVLT